jgi:hypothetical protein
MERVDIIGVGELIGTTAWLIISALFKNFGIAAAYCHQWPYGLQIWVVRELELEERFQNLSPTTVY